MDDRQVVIIGGGVAGISAAVHAIENGWQPLVLEATPHPGGRARSFFAKDISHTIDNGQHVLSAAYHETIWLLKKLGSIDGVHFQPALEIYFQLNNQRKFAFRSSRLPAPFHFLLPLVRHAPLTGADWRFLRRFGWQWLKTSAEDLRGATVREWLDSIGNAPFLEKLLWEPITLATLNTPVHKASAFLLHQTLKLAFLGNAKTCGLGIPKTGLSELFAKPFAEYLAKNGGALRSGTIVRKIVAENGRISALETHRGEQIEAKTVISAIPPHALSRILESSPEARNKLSLSLDKFEYSPIITVYLWLRKPIPTQFPAALVDSPVQWIFELPATGDADLHGYSLVISAAFDLANADDSAILEQVNSEFRHYFLKDLQSDFGLAAHKIIREKRATFLQTPESLRHRPMTETGIANFFLSGDWIDTELPATIESAVVSGKMAIAALSVKTG